MREEVGRGGTDGVGGMDRGEGWEVMEGGRGGREGPERSSCSL